MSHVPDSFFCDVQMFFRFCSCTSIDCTNTPFCGSFYSLLLSSEREGFLATPRVGQISLLCLDVGRGGVAGACWGCTWSTLAFPKPSPESTHGMLARLKKLGVLEARFERSPSFAGYEDAYPTLVTREGLSIVVAMSRIATLDDASESPDLY